MRSRHLLGAAVLALGLSTCHGYVAGSPEAGLTPCSPRGFQVVEFAELLLNLQRYEGQKVAVDGYILPTGSCEDPCDTGCTVDAKLAGARGAQDPKEAFFLISASGAGFGHCRADAQCQRQCDPPAGHALRVLGTVGAATSTPGEAYISVDRYCLLKG